MAHRGMAGRESCVDGACRAASRGPCDDGVACTQQVCFEERERCVLLPFDEWCSDGDACTGVEHCDPRGGCRPGPAPTCDDGDACTLDACDPVVGCVFTPRRGDPDCAP